MLESGDSHEPERRDEGHNRWLAMQSAYADYREASEALECTHHSDEDSSASERLRLILLQGQQRVAFERYLEARMAFLEFRFDESNRPGAGQGAPVAPAESAGTGSRFAFANCRPVLQILGVLLLCTTAFSLVREQRRVLDLEASRDELRATLNQTRDGLQLLGQKLDAFGPLQHPAIHQVEHTPHATARRQPAVREQKQVKRVPVSDTRSQNSGERYNFSLALSRQFKRVGPIELSLRSVDARRSCVSLSIASDPIKMDVPCLRLSQPVWINAGSRQQLLELVVDRIAVNRLEGHLIEPRGERRELRASRMKPKLPVSP